MSMKFEVHPNGWNLDRDDRPLILTKSGISMSSLNSSYEDVNPLLEECCVTQSSGKKRIPGTASPKQRSFVFPGMRRNTQQIVKKKSDERKKVMSILTGKIKENSKVYLKQFKNSKKKSYKKTDNIQGAKIEISTSIEGMTDRNTKISDSLGSICTQFSNESSEDKMSKPIGRRTRLDNHSDENSILSDSSNISHTNSKKESMHSRNISLDNSFQSFCSSKGSKWRRRRKQITVQSGNKEPSIIDQIVILNNNSPKNLVIDYSSEGEHAKGLLRNNCGEESPINCGEESPVSCGGIDMYLSVLGDLCFCQETLHVRDKKFVGRVIGLKDVDY